MPDADVDLYFLDEIGRLESLTPGLQLSGACWTAVARWSPPWQRKAAASIAAVKERPDIELVQLTRGNRDDLPEYLYRRLESALGSM